MRRFIMFSSQNNLFDSSQFHDHGSDLCKNKLIPVSHTVSSSKGMDSP
jgi:hypothetical protein